MRPHWTQDVAKSLSAGRPTPALEAHLDALLLWLSNPENPRAAELDRAIGRARLSRSRGAERAYRILDALLFTASDRPSTATLGLAPDVDPVVAKRRYRRLVQVYHPDRHPERIAWATHRTDQLNRAFDACRKGADGQKTNGGPNPARADRPAASSSGKGWNKTADALRSGLRAVWPGGWDWLARYAGRPGGTGRLLLTAVVGLIGVSIILGAIGLREAPKPIPRIIHHPLNETPASPVPASSPPASVITDTEPPAEEPARTPEHIQVATAENAAPVSEPEPEPLPVETTTDADAPSEPGLPQTAESPPIDATTARPADGAPGIDTEPAPASAAAPPRREAVFVPRESPSIDHAEPDQRAPERQAADKAISSTDQADQARLSPTSRIELNVPRLAIPAVAPPAEPRPPTAPEAPLIIGSATVAQPTTPAPTPPTVPGDCTTVPEILRRFQRGYQTGDLDQFMALYSPQARENDQATWFAIRQTYAAWFSTTSARRITFDQLQVEPVTGSDRCAARAVFQVSYLDGNALLATKAGIIQLLLEPEDGQLRILRVRY